MATYDHTPGYSISTLDYRPSSEFAPPPSEYAASGHYTSQPKITMQDKDGYANDPTPAEAEELNKPFIDWRAIISGKAWSVQKYIIVITFLIIGLVLFILYEVFHTKIIDALMPTFTKLKDMHFGWLIPIGIIFILSFPPLVGNEIVHLIVGAAWGLWIGFGIVAAGTILGETGTFLVFKYSCRARAEKIERENLYYGCIARVIRDANFLVNVIVRLSIIPTHISTAIFASTGMMLFTFIAGAVLALPKQFALVWLGAISVQTKETRGQKIANAIITIVTIAVTIGAMRFINAKIARVKLTVLRQMRARRSDPETGEFVPLTSGGNGASNHPYGRPERQDTAFIPPSGPPPAFSSEVELIPGGAERY